MGKFNFEIPEELHKKFKIYSIKKGKDMRELLVDYIKKIIKKDSINPSSNGGGSDLKCYRT